MSQKFRLERVRALRERREEAAKLEFAGALRRHVDSQQTLAHAGEQILSARAAQIEAAGSDAPIDLRSHQLYIERLERAQDQAREQLRNRAAELDQQRTALTRASQDREALERLKERSLAAHAQELARIEQNTLDEIAGIGHLRRAA